MVISYYSFAALLAGFALDDGHAGLVVLLDDLDGDLADPAFFDHLGEHPLAGHVVAILPPAS